VAVSLPNGGETVIFTLETTGDDSYGTPTYVPGGTPVTVSGCWVYPISSAEAQALGESINTVYAVLAEDSAGWRVLVDRVGWPVLGAAGRAAAVPLRVHRHVR
jgi:hypothetical protein